jgi:hypothetical protein
MDEIKTEKIKPHLKAALAELSPDDPYELMEAWKIIIGQAVQMSLWDIERFSHAQGRARSQRLLTLKELER